MSDGGASDDAGQEFGQRVELTQRIREILGAYTDDVSILKELLQNADDAGADTVAFCLDKRRFGTHSLVDEQMAGFQGPALLSFNNSVFTEGDLASIQRVGDSGKQKAREKAGKFGIGFNSVYHVTDLPSLITGDHLAFFDPHAAFVPAKSGGGRATGRLYTHTQAAAWASAHSDQLAPYRSAFGCKPGTRFEGTLFRLPLRTVEQASSSRLAPRSITPDSILGLFDGFRREAPHILLFLRHVRRVTLYEWEEHGTAPSTVFSVECAAERADLPSNLGDAAALPLELSHMKVKTVTNMSVVHNLGKEEATYEYVRCACGAYDSSPTQAIQSDELATAYGLKLVPYGAVAAPLTCTAPSGGGSLFCVLPLGSHAELPVHVNGGFEVSANRRDLWYEGGAQGISGIRRRWNDALLEAHVAPCYAVVLCALALTGKERSWTLWPSDSVVGNCGSAEARSPWAALAQAVISWLRSAACVPCIESPRPVRPDHVLVLPPDSVGGREAARACSLLGLCICDPHKYERSAAATGAGCHRKLTASDARDAVWQAGPARICASLSDEKPSNLRASYDKESGTSGETGANSGNPATTNIGESAADGASGKPRHARIALLSLCVSDVDCGHAQVANSHKKRSSSFCAKDAQEIYEKIGSAPLVWTAAQTWASLGSGHDAIIVASRDDLAAVSACIASEVVGARARSAALALLVHSECYDDAVLAALLQLARFASQAAGASSPCSCAPSALDGACGCALQRLTRLLYPSSWLSVCESEESARDFIPIPAMEQDWCTFHAQSADGESYARVVQSWCGSVWCALADACMQARRESSVRIFAPVIGGILRVHSNFTSIPVVGPMGRAHDIFLCGEVYPGVVALAQTVGIFALDSRVLPERKRSKQTRRTREDLWPASLIRAASLPDALAEGFVRRSSMAPMQGQSGSECSERRATGGSNAFSGALWQLCSCDSVAPHWNASHARVLAALPCHALTTGADTIQEVVESNVAILDEGGAQLLPDDIQPVLTGKGLVVASARSGVPRAVVRQVYERAGMRDASDHALVVEHLLPSARRLARIDTATKRSEESKSPQRSSPGVDKQQQSGLPLVVRCALAVCRHAANMPGSAAAAVREAAWVPDGEGLLRRACELFHPSVTRAAVIFGSELRCFPHPALCESDMALGTLAAAGLQHSLNAQHLLQAARAAAELAADGHCEGVLRGIDLAMYLDSNIEALLPRSGLLARAAAVWASRAERGVRLEAAEADSFFAALRETAWFPVHADPLSDQLRFPCEVLSRTSTQEGDADGSVAGSDAAVAFVESLGCHVRLARPCDVISASMSSLGGAVRAVAAVSLRASVLVSHLGIRSAPPSSADRKSGTSESGMRALSSEDVAQHLVRLVRLYAAACCATSEPAQVADGAVDSSNSGSGCDRGEAKIPDAQAFARDLSAHVGAVYQALEVALPHSAEDFTAHPPHWVALLRSTPCVWAGAAFGFVLPSRVALTCPIDAAPYLHTLAPDLAVSSRLFAALGVQSSFGASAYAAALRDLASQCGGAGSALDPASLALALRVAQCAAEAPRGNSAGDVGEILVPTSKGFLAAAHTCLFDDAPWMESEAKKGHDFVHERVAWATAERLGVRSLRLRVLASSAEALPAISEGLAEAFGQHEPLTLRLRNILELYPDSPSILHEFLQNADDAGAGEFWVAVDPGSYGTDSLLAPGMAVWQGPAVYVYNDALFSPADFARLARVGGGGKGDDAGAIGRFGLGFNSAYHFTDCPAFVSGSHAVFLDPHQDCVPGTTASRPGLRLRVEGTDVASRFPDQFAPFQVRGLGSSWDGRGPLRGTLFRFALRTAERAAHSEIRATPYPVEDAWRLATQFAAEAGEAVLFLHNVKRVVVGVVDPSARTARRVYDLEVADPSSRGTNLAARASLSAFSSGSAAEMRAKLRDTAPGNLPRANVALDVTERWIGGAGAAEFPALDDAVRLSGRTASLSGAPAAQRGIVAGIGHTRTVRWLVCALFCGGEALRLARSGGSTAGGEAAGALSGRLVPYTAVAAPVPRGGGDGEALAPVRGRAFCYLPLPQRTGLPVHIHGAFELSSSRRELLSGEDLRGEAAARAQWNAALLRDGVAVAYARLLVGAARLLGTAERVYYDLWPHANLAEPWAGVVQRQLSLCATHPVLHSKLNGGSWVAPRDALFAPSAAAGAYEDASVRVRAHPDEVIDDATASSGNDGEPGHVKSDIDASSQFDAEELVCQTALAAGMCVVAPPPHVYALLSAALETPPPVLDGRRLAAGLRCSPDALATLDDPDVCAAVLTFLAESEAPIAEWHDLPLILTASGARVPPRVCCAGDVSVLDVPPQFACLVVGCEHCVLHPDVAARVRTKSSVMAAFRSATLSAGDLLALAKCCSGSACARVAAGRLPASSGAQHGGRGAERASAAAANTGAEWARTWWKLVASPCRDGAPPLSVQSLEGWCVLIDMDENVGPLVSSAPAVDSRALPAAAAGALRELGVRTVAADVAAMCAAPTAFAPTLRAFVAAGTPEGVILALGAHKGRPAAWDTVDSTGRDALRVFLSSGRWDAEDPEASTSAPEVRNALGSLPIFRAPEWAGGEFYACARSDGSPAAVVLPPGAPPTSRLAAAVRGNTPLLHTATDAEAALAVAGGGRRVSPDEYCAEFVLECAPGLVESIDIIPRRRGHASSTSDATSIVEEHTAALVAVVEYASACGPTPATDAVAGMLPCIPVRGIGFAARTCLVCAPATGILHPRAASKHQAALGGALPAPAISGSEACVALLRRAGCAKEPCSGGSAAAVAATAAEAAAVAGDTRECAKVVAWVQKYAQSISTLARSDGSERGAPAQEEEDGSLARLQEAMHFEVDCAAPAPWFPWKSSSRPMRPASQCCTADHALVASSSRYVALGAPDTPAVRRLLGLEVVPADVAGAQLAALARAADSILQAEAASHSEAGEEAREDSGDLTGSLPQLLIDSANATMAALAECCVRDGAVAGRLAARAARSAGVARWVWTGSFFVEPSDIALDEGDTIPPFVYTLSSEADHTLRTVAVALSAPNTMSPVRYAAHLAALARKHGQAALPAAHARAAAHLVNGFAKRAKRAELERLRGALPVPASNGVLHAARGVYVDDAVWLAPAARRGVALSHPDVDKQAAFAVGSPSLRAALQRRAGRARALPCASAPPAQVRTTIRENEGVAMALGTLAIGDLVALADAAGAKHCAVGVDARAWGGAAVVLPTLAAAQGPALCVAFDADLTDELVVASTVDTLHVEHYDTDAGIAAAIRARGLLRRALVWGDVAVARAGDRLYIIDPIGRVTAVTCEPDDSRAGTSEDGDINSEAAIERMLSSQTRVFSLPESDLATQFPDTHAALAGWGSAAVACRRESAWTPKTIIRVPLHGEAVTPDMAGEALRRAAMGLSTGIALGESLASVYAISVGSEGDATNIGAALVRSAGRDGSRGDSRHSRIELLGSSVWRRFSFSALVGAYEPERAFHAITIEAGVARSLAADRAHPSAAEVSHSSRAAQGSDGREDARARDGYERRGDLVWQEEQWRVAETSCALSIRTTAQTMVNGCPFVSPHAAVAVRTGVSSPKRKASEEDGTFASVPDHTSPPGCALVGGYALCCTGLPAAVRFGWGNVGSDAWNQTAASSAVADTYGALMRVLKRELCADADTYYSIWPNLRFLDQELARAVADDADAIASARVDGLSGPTPWAIAAVGVGGVAAPWPRSRALALGRAVAREVYGTVVVERSVFLTLHGSARRLHQVALCDGELPTDVLLALAHLVELAAPPRAVIESIGQGPGPSAVRRLTPEQVRTALRHVSRRLRSQSRSASVGSSAALSAHVSSSSSAVAAVRNAVASLSVRSCKALLQFCVSDLPASAAGAKDIVGVACIPMANGTVSVFPGESVQASECVYIDRCTLRLAVLANAEAGEEVERDTTEEPRTDMQATEESASVEAFPPLAHRILHRACASVPTIASYLCDAGVARVLGTKVLDIDAVVAAGIFDAMLPACLSPRSEPQAYGRVVVAPSERVLRSNVRETPWSAWFVALWRAVDSSAIPSRVAGQWCVLPADDACSELWPAQWAPCLIAPARVDAPGAEVLDTVRQALVAAGHPRLHASAPIIPILGIEAESDAEMRAKGLVRIARAFCCGLIDFTALAASDRILVGSVAGDDEDAVARLGDDELSCIARMPIFERADSPGTFMAIRAPAPGAALDEQASAGRQESRHSVASRDEGSAAAVGAVPYGQPRVFVWSARSAVRASRAESSVVARRWLPLLRRLGVPELGDADVLRTFVIPHFASLSREEQHRHIVEIFRQWDDLGSDHELVAALRELAFVPRSHLAPRAARDGAVESSLARPQDLLDPSDVLLSRVFSDSASFPPAAMRNPAWLEFLAALGLPRRATSESSLGAGMLHRAFVHLDMRARSSAATESAAATASLRGDAWELCKALCAEWHAIGTDPDVRRSLRTLCIFPAVPPQCTGPHRALFPLSECIVADDWALAYRVRAVLDEEITPPQAAWEIGGLKSPPPLEDVLAHAAGASSGAEGRSHELASWRGSQGPEVAAAALLRHLATALATERDQERLAVLRDRCSILPLVPAGTRMLRPCDVFLDLERPVPPFLAPCPVALRPLAGALVELGARQAPDAATVASVLARRASRRDALTPTELHSAIKCLELVVSLHDEFVQASEHAQASRGGSGAEAPEEPGRSGSAARRWPWRRRERESRSVEAEARRTERAIAELHVPSLASVLVPARDCVYDDGTGLWRRVAESCAQRAVHPKVRSAIARAAGVPAASAALSETLARDDKRAAMTVYHAATQDGSNGNQIAELAAEELDDMPLRIAATIVRRVVAALHLAFSSVPQESAPRALPESQTAAPTYPSFSVVPAVHTSIVDTISHCIVGEVAARPFFFDREEARVYVAADPLATLPLRCAQAYSATLAAGDPSLEMVEVAFDSVRMQTLSLGADTRTPQSSTIAEGQEASVASARTAARLQHEAQRGDPGVALTPEDEMALRYRPLRRLEMDEIVAVVAEGSAARDPTDIDARGAVYARVAEDTSQNAVAGLHAVRVEVSPLGFARVPASRLYTFAELDADAYLSESGNRLLPASEDHTGERVNDAVRQQERAQDERGRDAEDVAEALRALCERLGISLDHATSARAADALQFRQAASQAEQRVARLEAQVRELERDLRERDENLLCPICQTTEVNMALGCGHALCIECRQCLHELKCPMCRANIVHEQRLFLS